MSAGELIRGYWAFMSRPGSEEAMPSGFDVMPNFYRDTAIWCAVFSALFMAVPVLAKTLNPEWYGQLDTRKRKELPTYVVCLLHHLCLVPMAWVHIFQDVSLSADQAMFVDYASKEAVIAPFSFAYLFSDSLFFALPEAFSGKFEYILHHIMTIYLVVSTVIAPGNLSRFIPHLLICDTSNVFFNTAWLLRLYGLRGSSLVVTLEILFAVAFFFARTINLPVTFLALSQHPFFATLGFARFTIGPIALMQWYWFYKVLSNIFSRIAPSKTKAQKKKD